MLNNPYPHLKAGMVCLNILPGSVYKGEVTLLSNPTYGSVVYGKDIRTIWYCLIDREVSESDKSQHANSAAAPCQFLIPIKPDDEILKLFEQEDKELRKELKNTVKHQKAKVQKSY